MEKVYLVRTDVYDGYGAEFYLIGTFSDFEKAFDSKKKFIEAIIEEAKINKDAFAYYYFDDGKLNEERLRLDYGKRVYMEEVQLDKLYSLPLHIISSKADYDIDINLEDSDAPLTCYLGGYVE